MSLVAVIQLHGRSVALDQLSMEYPQFVLVLSQGYLKIYRQVVA